ncbi:MAG: segregation/condensation protein A [Coriobacteriales bacterium]|nr:segregation/condensation protein A [Coriobacteriales bacterium]MBQ6585576.1 segregation/condensation protein A [Coriobacteriales bacterium]
MSYRVKIDAFEGPFDLLLHLVARQRVDIAAVSVSDIADQYLAHIERMKDFDLDVASDFLVVASQLLEIKAAALLPKQEIDYGDDLDDLSPEEARDVLIERLIAYKQFQNCARALGARMENEGRMHPRTAGVESEYLTLLPDYLKGVTLHSLAVICADLASRRETFLLEAEHIAAMPIPLEIHAESVHRRLQETKHSTFKELLGENPEPPILVVTFLAILELYKRGVVNIAQNETFGDIDIDLLDEAKKDVES